MTLDARANLRAVLNPRSVAIIGASENPNKIGGRPLLYLSRFGYQGQVYPINPKRSEAQGFKTYPDLAALPEVPEVAVIVVPGDLALQSVEACGRAGVKVAIVMASGFGETASADAQAQERRMTQVARETGMRVIGPNSQGVANFASGAVLSFSTMFLEATPQDGPIAIVSQSGGMSVVPYGLLRARGLGVRHVHATGNDCDVSVGELASVLAEDPELKLLLLYLETIRDAEAVAQMAQVARGRGLPVIALKSGRTSAGQEAARSHTGALANEDRVVDAFFEQHGIWRAQNMSELVQAAEMYLKGWRPQGRRLVVVSNSGAVCVMAADAATAAGMPMARLSDATRSTLNAILPSFATTSNPVDITAALLSNSRLFGDILPALASDPAADAFLIGIPVAGQGYDIDAFAQDSAAFAAQTGKPVAVSAPQHSVASRFKAEGLPVFQTEADAIAALNQFVSHLELIGNAQTHAPAHVSGRSTHAQTGRMLNEAESLALLQRHGVPVIGHRLCRTADEAVHALTALGAPVAVKGCSADIVHKTELMLVQLNLRTADEVRAAFHRMQSVIERQRARFDGVIVARMASGRRELMIGARVDPVFGPVVVVGDGGKYVEAMPDVQLLLPPFRSEQVERAMSRLRIAPLLAGVRGEPPLDVEAFSRAAEAIGRLLLDAQAGVTNLDLNPIIVGNRGEGCWAVDAVVYAVRDQD
jgi:acyl-CoA synthetase (NDP forming)